MPPKRITEGLALLKVMRGKMHNAMCFITSEEQNGVVQRVAKRAAVVPATVNVDTKSMSELPGGELYNWSKTEKRWMHDDTQHQALRGAHAEVYHAYRAYKEILIELDNAVQIAYVQSKGDAEWQPFPRHEYWHVSSETETTSPKTISPFENQKNLESVRQALPRDPSKQTKSAAFGRKLSQFTCSHPMTSQKEDDKNHQLYMEKLEEANPAGVDNKYISEEDKQGGRPWYTRSINALKDRRLAKHNDGAESVIGSAVIAIAAGGDKNAAAVWTTLAAKGDNTQPDDDLQVEVSAGKRPDDATPGGRASG